MKKYFFLALALLPMAGFYSCGRMTKKAYKRAEAAQTYPLENFKKIVMDGASDVIYQQADEYSVRVVADKKELQSMSLSVNGDRLVIAEKDHSLFFRNTIRKKAPVIYVSSPDLVAVDMVGAGDFKIKGLMDTDTLCIRQKGVGDLEIDRLLCDEVHVSCNGMGDVEIKELESSFSGFFLKGTGDMRVKQYRVDHSNIKLVGIGDIAVENIDCGNIYASLTGTGDIELSGNVRRLTKEKEGTGSIDTSGLRVNMR